MQSEAPVKIMFVHPGTMSIEIRHIIRDPIDLTAALLANCGDKDKFFANHNALMLKQTDWLAKYDKLTKAQTDRWQTGANSARRRAIASDLGFYAIMEGRGYDRVQADRCLADETLATKLVADTEADHEKYEVHSTPSFAINGELQENVHNWLNLQLAIAKYL
jgi:protein-disulfide isomerase